MMKERNKYDNIKSKHFCQNFLQGKTHYKQNEKQMSNGGKHLQ